MKSLRNSFLTLLALTLFGGAGAWAQGPNAVTAAEINSDVYSGWTSLDNELFKASELPGFQAVTEDQAKSWAGVPSTGNVNLYYEFVADGHVKYVRFENGVYEGSYEENELERYLIYEDIAYNGNTKYFYTTGGGAIELTKEGANQWTLGQAPDYDLELQVEYYEAHALKDIPEGWQVKVNGVDKTSAIVGDSLMITETDSVTLIPAGNRRRVKSVTLEDEAPAAVTITIGEITLDITGCTTWSDIIARNPGVIWESYGLVASGEEALKLSGNSVHPSDPYDPALQSNYYWQVM